MHSRVTQRPGTSSIGSRTEIGTLVDGRVSCRAASQRSYAAWPRRFPLAQDSAPPIKLASSTSAWTKSGPVIPITSPKMARSLSMRATLALTGVVGSCRRKIRMVIPPQRFLNTDRSDRPGRRPCVDQGREGEWETGRSNGWSNDLRCARWTPFRTALLLRVDAFRISSFAFHGRALALHGARNPFHGSAPSARHPKSRRVAGNPGAEWGSFAGTSGVSHPQLTPKMPPSGGHRP